MVNASKLTVTKMVVVILIMGICILTSVSAKTDAVLLSTNLIGFAGNSIELEELSGFQHWMEKQQGYDMARLDAIALPSTFYGKEVFWMAVSGIVVFLGLFCLCCYFYFKRKTIGHSQQHEYLVQAAYFNKMSNQILLGGFFNRAITYSTQNKTLLCICFVDLHGLKQVNENYGYKAGDLLLIEVAERIKANITEHDTVSRQGGDEFVLLLSDNKSVAYCEHLLESIIHILNQPFVINEQQITIDVSIGVSLYSSIDNDLDTLIAHADQAMHQAQLIGRNRYDFFTLVPNQLSINKHNRFQEIQQAFLGQQFCLYYQPKTNMTTGKVFGVEALLRWIHPEKGLILPLTFLPAIEGSKLEIQIGNWVVNEAIKQLDLWNKQGFELEMSINVSSHYLQSQSFVAELGATLAKYSDLDPGNIQLEILETSALGDLNTISSIIKTCVDTLGVTIALDDFGTGYSSLTHLRHLPVHTIKIDQTFVKDVLVDPNDYSIVDGVIALASSFNRNVIAEGIETPEQGLMLLIMGCDEAQGYEISPPISSSEVVNWLKNYIPNQQWIDCCNKVYSPREKKLVLFRLALSRWQTLFEHHLQFPPGNTQYWPIMNNKECLCGYWIKRMRQEQEQLFEERWLERLEQSYDYIHSISNDLYDKYQKGKFGAAKDGLIDIRRAFDKMNDVLQQCE